ncbi:MAG: substrate-binding domain-containing protein [Planctomycetota bacterium]
MSKRPKHETIHEDLARLIGDVTLAPGRQLPTEAELVRTYKASRPTVTRVMQRLVLEGLVERRAGAGTFVRRGATTSSARLFGLLIPGLGETEIFEPLCGQMARDAQSHQHTLLWGDASDHGPGNAGERAVALARDYAARRVGGVFFAPLELFAEKESVNATVIEILDKANIPVILLDRDIVRHPDRSRHDVVAIDHRRAGHMLVAHLLGQGIRRISFVARPLSAPSIGLRIAGYRDALREAGIEPSSKAVHFGDPSDAAFVRRVLAGGQAEAIVCGNDVTAARLLHTLDELGVLVPGDVRVAGFDDVRYANLLRVPLTTIHQPCRDLGTVAVQAMMERLTNPGLPARDILLGARLVVRRSTTGRRDKPGAPDR